LDKATYRSQRVIVKLEGVKFMPILEERYYRAILPDSTAFGLDWIGAILEMRAEKDGERRFVYFRDQIIDFVTLDRKVNKMANLLRNLGVNKGGPRMFIPRQLP
jgi:hypothetical protein